MSIFARCGLAAALALASLSAPAYAQGTKKPPPGKPAPAAPPEPAPPAVQVFPCRTADETCYLGIVVGGQLAVLFTNAPGAEDVGAKPVDPLGPDGAKLDMGKAEGRVVMLTGAYDPAKGITKAELVEVASPLASLAIKAQLAAGQNEEPAAPPPGRKAPPPKRR